MMRAKFLNRHGYDSPPCEAHQAVSTIQDSAWSTIDALYCAIGGLQVHPLHGCFG
jgi:hypothetical protein